MPNIDYLSELIKLTESYGEEVSSYPGSRYLSVHIFREWTNAIITGVILDEDGIRYEYDNGINVWTLPAIIEDNHVSMDIIRYVYSHIPDA